MRSPVSLSALATLILLAACGGGGGGGASDPVQNPAIPGPVTPGDAAPATTDGLRRAATGLLDIWAPGGVADYTSLAAVPASGSASYGGYLYGDLSTDGGAATDSLIGRLTLTATFSADSAAFSGRVNDVVDSRDDPLSGTLAVSGGSLNRSGNPASDATLRGIAVDGTLRDGDGTTLDVGLRLEGDFLGSTAQALGGEALGRVTVGSTRQDFDGGFIAAR